MTLDHAVFLLAKDIESLVHETEVTSCKLIREHVARVECLTDEVKYVENVCRIFAPLGLKAVVIQWSNGWEDGGEVIVELT